MRLILRIYDYFSSHKKILWGATAVVSALLVALVLNLRYSEDISDFLPLGNSDREALDVYQSISGADRLIILFDNPGDDDMTVEAIDRFTEIVQENDSEQWCSRMSAEFDLGSMLELTDFVYENIPYFLKEEDYARIDSLLCVKDFVPGQLENDKRMLMLPSGSMMGATLSKDPLGLYAPVLSRLRGSDSSMRFEMYSGHIFTPDMSKAVVMLSSPFGNSETEGNSKLLALLDEAIEQMREDYPEVQAHVVGGPEIAVGNARRIKKDSIIAISLSAVLIVLLLIMAFNSVRDILLIFLSIGWGWLFAMGGMSLFSSDVSIIVIGISSVILGIAVNYPLHLIAHLSHQRIVRSAIGEIMAPLVVGNITTVGAFLALVPLQSTALRDLGTFASLLLVGTILFVLLCLPHLVKVKEHKERKFKLLDTLASFSPEKYKSIVIGSLVLTAVLAFFSLRVEFDSNMANINYMTKAQKEDMAYFQKLLSDMNTSTTRSVYALSRGDDYDNALAAAAIKQDAIDSLIAQGLVSSHKGVSDFLVSKKDQERRLEMWEDFISRHGAFLKESIKTHSASCGFSQEAFEPFLATLEAPVPQPQEIEYFSALTSLVLSQNLTSLDQTGKAYVIDVLSVEKENIPVVKERLGQDCFDVESMNSALSDNLSDNFNYIGWACSLIVFFFLWFSFGRLELALISFLPMAVSWVWILGIMGAMGLKFNIVNVILATFIFGQGDDYTIFMTEGCQHEYTFRRPILSSYKNSIIQSALIMFVGIGTLIVARHPAMRSLAQVTIIGMFSVVLMAYMIPPLLFGWITRKNGKVRRYPVTLRSLLLGVPKDPVALVKGRYIYKGKEIGRRVSANLREFVVPSVPDSGEIIMDDPDGYGERAILTALTYPDVAVRVRIKDEDALAVAKASAEGFTDNVIFE